MRRFFEEHKLDINGLSENRVNKIKYSVLAQVEGGKPMKKRFKFKPLVIAAAIIGTMALSAVSVNAATNGAFLSAIFKTHKTTTLNTKYGDIIVTIDAYADGEPDEHKPSGASVGSERADNFTGRIHESFGCGAAIVKFDDADFVQVYIMWDGDAIGYKVVYRTGEVTLLTDEEIEKAIKNHNASNEEFDKHMVVVSDENGVVLGKADLPDDVLSAETE